ncbi:hypothetical protein SO802_020574 [Lithocarpus litseifolius]|uniref:Uncharacterized protein n=1 Tax=Lithocarpus litseifolius TaxID=425828 RepID=A0AAW2CCX0_9ROSI
MQITNLVSLWKGLVSFCGYNSKEALPFSVTEFSWIDITDVLSLKGYTLLRGHQELFVFNTLLPEGYEITVPLQGDPVLKNADFGRATNFVNQDKQQFIDDEQRYNFFLEVLVIPS